MTSAEILERINKAKLKLEKKESLLKKKIEKCEVEIKEVPNCYVKMNYVRENYSEVYKESYLKYCEIESIYNTSNDILDLKALILKYEEQLNKQQIKESKLVAIPQVLTEFKNHLIECWNKYDKQRRENLKKTYKEIGYTEFFKKFTISDYDLISKSDKEIEKENEKASEQIILNMLSRVEEKVGVVTDCDGLHVSSDNLGYSVINGSVTGTKGSCYIESIGAGGYNIQRYHVRVLVK